MPEIRRVNIVIEEGILEWIKANVDIGNGTANEWERVINDLLTERIRNSHRIE